MKKCSFMWISIITGRSTVAIAAKIKVRRRNNLEIGDYGDYRKPIFSLQQKAWPGVRLTTER